MEPLVLTAAFGLGSDDPAVMVLAAYPEAVADAATSEAELARWAAEWAGTWRRRFG